MVPGTMSLDCLWQSKPVCFSPSQRPSPQFQRTDPTPAPVALLLPTLQDRPTQSPLTCGQPPIRTLDYDAPPQNSEA